MRKSLQVSLIAVFAALHAVLYFMSFGLWRNWGIYLAPIEGIVLGPEIGFFSALIGSATARLIRPDAAWMFGVIAEPISVLLTGLLVRGRWKPVLAVYGILLAAYFASPTGRALPLWTILDILLAMLLLFPAAKISHYLFNASSKRLPIALALISFICIATDSLLRVFLLVPCGLYSAALLLNSEALYAVFVAAAVDSYIEDAIVVIVSVIVGIPLLLSILKLKFLRKNGDRD